MSQVAYREPRDDMGRQVETCGARVQFRSRGRERQRENGEIEEERGRRKRGRIETTERKGGRERVWERGVKESAFLVFAAKGN